MILASLRLSACLSPLLGLMLAACAQDPDLIIYTSVDQVHSESLLERFEEETGLTVRVEFDTEATKTVGLVERLRAESAAPRCDVFWNNEIANTIALAEEGLLATYDSPSAAEIPASFRDRERRWTGFAARARIMIENLNEVPEDSRPSGFMDLFDTERHPNAAIARPLEGTTLTHFAVLGTLLGEDELYALAERIMEQNRAGKLAMPGGNGPLAKGVASGATAWGFTDTDDFNVMLANGHPVRMGLPDQGNGDGQGDGLILIPNTVMILKDAPRRAAAEQFVDWLLSKEVEALIAESDSANIPVRPDVPRPDGVLSLEGVRLMPIDWNDVGRRLPAIQERLKEIVLR